MFFADQNLREGYYLTFKLLSLQSSVEKKRKGAEYWYYLFETVPADTLTQGSAVTQDGLVVHEETFSYAEIDEWIDFFCELGNILRDETNWHAAAVKYYSTGISLLRSMISRRNETFLAHVPNADSGLSDTSVEVAAKVLMKRTLLKLGRALLGIALCINVDQERVYTWEMKKEADQSKLSYLNESIEIFRNNDLSIVSNNMIADYEADYILANKTRNNLMLALSADVDSKATKGKKVFKRKKKRKGYDMISPLA